ncbi:MAG: hypothetical protein ACOY0T_39190 [Myxococcota bacterium]
MNRACGLGAFVFVWSCCTLGCAAPQRGVPQTPPAPLEFSRAAGGSTLVVSEPNGPKVYWHGPTGRAKYPATEHVGLVALSQKELEILWVDLGRPTPVPRVDFGRYVVFGAGELSGVCPGNVLAVDVEPGRVLRMRGAPSPGSCPERTMQAAQIVAIPRSVAHDRVVFVPFEFMQAYAFTLPAAP